MKKEVYESPFTEKMEVVVEGNFCSSGDEATIPNADATIHVEDYESTIGTAEKVGIEHEITFD
ncbi:MAG: hypothetical protein LUD00_10160 [Prevotellaceae bacterium]|nr:hypothetical protein [Prevotellaceae bacterium]